MLNNLPGDLTGYQAGKYLVVKLLDAAEDKWQVECPCGIQKALTRQDLKREVECTNPLTCPGLSRKNPDTTEFEP